MSEKSPDPNLAPARVCDTCAGLGTVPDALRPGAHTLCPQCQRRSLPFTLPPAPPVTEAEHAECDRRVAEAAAPSPLVWASVDVAADRLTIHRGTRDEFEVPLSMLRTFSRHDDLLPRLVACFCAGLAAGVGLVGVLLWML